MNIAYRFRIYPTEEQKILLGKTFGCCRFLYNQMLNDKIQEYKKTKNMLKIHQPCIKGVSISERSRFAGTGKCSASSGESI
ncbi:MAG: helix-turn-helix domain-containing protein [Blautia wexlerae]